MERSAKIGSIDYNYDAQIPYDSKLLWVNLQNGATITSLQKYSQARIVSLDHNQGQSIKSVTVFDIIGTKVALKYGDRLEERGYISRDSYLVW